MNPSSFKELQQPSTTDNSGEEHRTNTSSLLPGRVSLASSSPTATEAVRAASELCNNTTAMQNDDNMDELRAEVARLKKVNEDLERKLLQASAMASSAKSGEKDDETQQQQQCGLKKSGKTMDLKMLDDKSNDESSSQQNRRRSSADRKKIERLELHLLETQRRSEETQATLESKLNQALETNRVLQVENSLKLDEMSNCIDELKAKLDTEDWCATAMSILCDNVRSSGRNDKMCMIKSRYGRMLREKDQHVRELEEACGRKDRAIEMLAAELKGAGEEIRRLKLAEAASLMTEIPLLQGKVSSKPFEFKGNKTSNALSSRPGAVPIPQRSTLRRNSAHASCA